MPQIGRAEALQRLMLAMISRAKNDEAHPAFWAQFLLGWRGALAA